MGEDQNDFFQSAIRGTDHALAISDLETKLLEDRNQAVIDFVIQLFSDTQMKTFFDIPEDQRRQMLSQLWEKADGELGSQMFSLMNEEEKDELSSLQSSGASHDELWSYFDMHILMLEEKMAEVLYYFGLEYLSKALSLPQNISSIENDEVIKLAEQLEEDRENAEFTFNLEVVRTKGIVGNKLPSLSTPEGKQVSAEIENLNYKRDLFVFRQLYLMLKVYNPAKAEEYRLLNNQGISAKKSFEFFETNLNSFIPHLAIAMINFRRSELSNIH